MTGRIEKDFVVIKGSQWAGPLFDGWTKRVSEAGLFSRAEAEAHVAGKKADGYSIQPLAFYEEFFLEEKKRIESMLQILGVTA